MDITEGSDDFYEDLNADFSASLGELKTPNPDHDRFQRRWVHLSPEKSRFKKTVEMVLCVHGKKSATDPVPMTLVVLGVELSCRGRDFRFQSVRIFLRFHEDDRADPPNRKPANPTVVAFAPWVQEKRGDPSKGKISQKKGGGATVGIDKYVKAELSGNLERQIEFTRLYFDRGTASRLPDYHTGRIYGVEWYCAQNDLQKHGVEPYFLVAALIQRDAVPDGQPLPTFSAVYDMSTEAGFRHDLDQGARSLFRLRKPEDAPIYFDPTRPHMACGLDDKGLSLLDQIDPNNLGVLAKGDHLSMLLEPKTKTYLPAFRPLRPPKATDDEEDEDEDEDEDWDEDEDVEQ